MNIRDRLLYLLLPPLIAFVALSTVFFYYQWRREILATFRARLEAVVVTAARGITSPDVEWLYQQGGNEQAPRFKNLQQQLRAIAQATSIDSLFIIAIEPVQPGETVLLNRPADPTNPLYMGSETSLTHRQIYLLDVNSTAVGERHAGSYDFSETDEQLIYYTKRPFVTPIYTTRQDDERLISAYAPLFNQNGHVLALLGADVSMLNVDQKLQRALLSLIGSALATVFLVSLSVLAAANKISRPVQQLKDAALNLAAGEYGTTIPEVIEPQEMAELANTLNTMSACLREHIERLQQNATARERLFGEYECALLLQKRMFQNACEQFKLSHLRLRGLSTEVAAQPHGVYVHFEAPVDHELVLHFCENSQQGFSGIYYLLQTPSLASHAVQVRFNWSQKTLDYVCKDLPAPILWSQRNVIFLHDSQGEQPFHDGDIVLLTGAAIREIFPREEDLEQWLRRLFKNYDGTDFDLFTAMVDREIDLIGSQHHLEHDLCVVCAQLVVCQN